MANVKDLLVNGSARVVGTIYGTVTSANNSDTLDGKHLNEIAAAKSTTLSWNTSSTIATIGGNNITITMPENPIDSFNNLTEIEETQIDAIFNNETIVEGDTGSSLITETSEEEINTIIGG